MMWSILFALSFATAAAVDGVERSRIGAFNIEVFGISKISKPAVVDTIVAILQRYDLVLVQEIRDKSETAIYDLLAVLNNATNDAYNATISERLGRTNSKEQYAFFYRTATWKVLDTLHHNDSESDLFEREPYAILVQDADECSPQFSLIAAHISPSDAVAELTHLVAAYNETVSRWNVTDSLLLGDFNAGCSYVPKKAWNQIALWTDERFTWLLDSSVDTTVAASSCPYDRFVVAGSALLSLVINGSASVFRFDSEYNLTSDEADDVSDHYPIELDLRLADCKTQPPSVIAQSTVSTATATVDLEIITSTSGGINTTTRSSAAYLGSNSFALILAVELAFFY